MTALELLWAARQVLSEISLDCGEDFYIITKWLYILYRLTGLIHISNKQRISLNIQFVGFKSDLEFFKKNQTGGESLSKQYHISFRLPDYAKKKIFVVLRASIYGTSYLVNRFRFHLKGSSFSNQSNGILRNEKNPQRWNNRKLNHDSPENHTIFP